MLQVDNLTKHFILNNGRTLRAVNGVSFHAQENEVLGVVGESGCGKSTLGRLILRLVEPSGGQVYFEDEEITRLNRGALRQKRKSMQMVFQNPFASFNPKMRIGAALNEVCRYYGMDVRESQETIGQMLHDTGLLPDLLKRWPRELSGGQLQRLAIARALLSRPSLLIADEPLSALDVSVQAQLLNLFDDLRTGRSMVMIFISHDMGVVEYFCDHVAVMYMGMIMEFLPAAELSHALHPYTRSLRAAAPRLDAFNDPRAGSRVLHGETPNPLLAINGCPFAPRCPEARPLCGESLPDLTEVSSGRWLRCLRNH